MKNEDSKHTKVAERNMPDNVLKCMAALTDELGAGISVTLIMKGLIISGTTVAGKEFFRNISDRLSKKQDKVADALAQQFQFFSTLLYPGDKEQTTTSNYIHIKNVKFINGTGGVTGLSGSILRINIDEIDGYSFGELS